PGGTRRRSRGGSRWPGARRRTPPRPPARTGARGPRRTSWEESLQLFLEIEARPVETRPHRADGQLERLGDLLVREALDVSQDHDDPALLGELADRPMERLLDLAPLERLVRPRPAVGEPGERLLAVARQPALAPRQPVEAETRRDR